MTLYAWFSDRYMPFLRPWRVLLCAVFLTACDGGGGVFNAGDRPLANTRWITDAGQTLVFEGLSAIHGFAGCNTYSAQVEFVASRMTLGLLRSTGMYCFDALGALSGVSSVMVDENRFFDSLRLVRQWRIDDERLVLLDASGRVMLWFKPGS